MKLLIIDSHSSVKYKIFDNLEDVKIDLVHSISDAVWYLWDEYDIIVLHSHLKDSLLFARIIANTHNEKAKIIIYCDNDGQEFCKILPNAMIREAHVNN